MDIASIFALALSCTALSPPSHVTAVAAIASEGDVYRVEVDGRPAAAANATEAFNRATAAAATGHHVMVGLGLLTPEELKAAGMDIGDGLSACQALSGLDFILADIADDLDIADEDKRWTRAAAIRASGYGDEAAIADFSAQIEEIVSALPDEGSLTRQPGSAAPSNSGAAHAPVPDDVSAPAGPGGGGEGACAGCVPVPGRFPAPDFLERQVRER